MRLFGISLMSGMALSMLLVPGVWGGDELRQGTEPDVILDYDEPPRPVKITQPVYPSLAFEAGIEGTVVLDIVIDRSGRVARAKVKNSVPELDEAALTCVRAWRFKPAKKAGRAIATVAEAAVTFRRDVRKDSKS